MKTDWRMLDQISRYARLSGKSSDALTISQTLIREEQSVVNSMSPRKICTACKSAKSPALQEQPSGSCQPFVRMVLPSWLTNAKAKVFEKKWSSLHTDPSPQTRTASYGKAAGEETVGGTVLAHESSKDWGTSRIQCDKKFGCSGNKFPGFPKSSRVPLHSPVKCLMSSQVQSEQKRHLGDVGRPPLYNRFAVGP